MNTTTFREWIAILAPVIVGQLVAVFALVPLHLTEAFWFSAPFWVTVLALSLYAGVVTWIGWGAICLTQTVCAARLAPVKKHTA